MSAPWLRSTSAWPARSYADDPAERPGPAGFDPRHGVLDDRRALRRPRAAPRRPEEHVGRGLALAGSARAATSPSTRTSNSSECRPRPSTSRQFLLADTTARRETRCARLPPRTYGALVALDAVALEHSSTRTFLRFPTRARCRPGRSSGEPSGSTMPRDARNARTPSWRRLAIHIGGVVVGRERFRITVRGEEGVEDLRPCGGVHLRRMGQNAVEVEQERNDPCGGLQTRTRRRGADRSPRWRHLPLFGRASCVPLWRLAVTVPGGWRVAGRRSRVHRSTPGRGAQTCGGTAHVARPARKVGSPRTRTLFRFPGAQRWITRTATSERSALGRSAAAP